MAKPTAARSAPEGRRGDPPRYRHQKPDLRPADCKQNARLPPLLRVWVRQLQREADVEDHVVQETLKIFSAALAAASLENREFSSVEAALSQRPNRARLGAYFYTGASRCL